MIPSAPSPGGTRAGVLHALLLLAGTAALAACGGEPGGDAPAEAAGDAMSETAPAPPGQVLPRLEERLLASPMSLFFEVTSEGAIEVFLGGRLVTAPGNRARLEVTGEFAGEPQELLLASDGDTLTMIVNGERTSGPTPPELNDALVVGLTRMGILHNIARLTGAAPPDHGDGGVRDWVAFADPNLVEAEVGDGSALSFDLVVADTPSGSATLELYSTGLPLERRQVVDFPQGQMRVREVYADVVLGASVGPGIFEPTIPGRAQSGVTGDGSDVGSEEGAAAGAGR